MDPLAITAAACRFPGAGDLDAFWENLASARPTPTSSLEARWDLPRSRYFDADPAQENTTYLEDAFCLGPELLPTIPGQDRQETLGRLVLTQLLEERGEGLDLERTALVVATNYVGESYFRADAAAYLAPIAPGLSADSAESASAEAGPRLTPERLLDTLAEVCGTQGPRLSVDTACSSSLYAIDIARGLLRSGQADAVIVCGLTGYLPLFLFIGFSRLRAFSPERQIKPFAADASGILLGEGCGAILLEREATAPLALVRGLGLSSDGNDRSVFAPGRDGQRLAYERAYAGLDPSTVDYVEAHGTATGLGDATELSTLDEFFAPHRAGGKLPIGSVKGLIGHQLAAAGMASLLKGILMLRKGLIPPHLPVEPHAALRETCCELPRAARPWAPAPERPRRLGISAFGFGGSNAHLVLEEAPAAWSDPVLGSRPNLVISDLEVICGAAQDTASWAAALAKGEAPESSFSAERFGLFRDEVPTAPARSTYFPPRISLETKGLRMGPKILARLDPFQLLLTQLGARLLARRPELKDSAETGIVVLSNVGGALMLQQYRRFTYATQEPEPDPRVCDFLSQATTTEAIASSMTTMCSGYPAFHLNLRGLHETLSGPAGSLLNALVLGQHFLDGHCSALLLGAGSQIKSPLDHERLGERSGEGAALFLLETEATAASRGVSPLAKVRAVTLEGDLAAACAEAGLDPSQVESRERVQLDPGGPEPGPAQELAGYLSEACGIEGLTRLLLIATPGRVSALEFWAGDSPRGVLLLESLRRAAPKRPTPERPVEVPFLPGPRPRATQQGREGEAALGAAAFLSYVHETAGAVKSLLRLQRAALARLGPPSRGEGPDALALASALAAIRPDPVHRVLEDLRSEEGVLSGQLVVNESHPFFFDHPLDHAPGILLVEGLAQLYEAYFATQPLPAGEVWFLRDMSLEFRSFCEKDEPARVILEERPLAPGQHRTAFLGRILQGERVVLTTTLQLARVPLPSASGSPPEPWPGDANPAIVRKRRLENVLCSELIRDGDAGRFLFSDPPPDHLLAAGPSPIHGPTYLLETVRQSTSLGSYAVEPESFGLPRILISLRLSLDAPLLRGEPLGVRIERQPYTRVGETFIADLRCELRGPQGPVGSMSLKSQNQDPEAYLRARARAKSE